jgi:hypothetical protein
MEGKGSELEAPTMGGTYFAEGGHMIGSSGPVATWGGSRSGSNSKRPPRTPRTITTSSKVVGLSAAPPRNLTSTTGMAQKALDGLSVVLGTPLEPCIMVQTPPDCLWTKCGCGAPRVMPRVSLVVVLEVVVAGRQVSEV